MRTDAGCLFAAESALRAEADDMLARSGIGPILSSAGYHAAGSYVMRTMTWRDLDLEREGDADLQSHWDVGTQLAQTGWLWRASYVDARGEEGVDRPPGLYWGLRLSDPSRPSPATVWKMDLWAFGPVQARKLAAARSAWASLMTEELRAEILAIKRDVCAAPEYRKTLFSVHVYEAVLECGVRNTEVFWEWWRERIGTV